jgi:hypothetical protein
MEMNKGKQYGEKKADGVTYPYGCFMMGHTHMHVQTLGYKPSAN